MKKKDAFNKKRFMCNDEKLLLYDWNYFCLLGIQSISQDVCVFFNLYCHDIDMSLETDLLNGINKEVKRHRNTWTPVPAKTYSSDSCLESNKNRLWAFTLQIQVG